MARDSLITATVSTFFFFFNDTATTEIYTLSLHDALPISFEYVQLAIAAGRAVRRGEFLLHRRRSEEHTSELQSLAYLVCRLLLEKKKEYKSIVLRSTRSLNSRTSCATSPGITFFLLRCSI